MAIGTLSRGGAGSLRPSKSGRVTSIGARPSIWRRPGALKRALSLFLLGLLTATACTLVYGLWRLRSIAEHLPSVANIAAIRLSKVTTVVSSDGVVLATLQTQDRKPVALADISSHLIDATLATEDARFYQHGAVDPYGIARAVWHNFRGGDATGQGASTISQQLARSLYLSNRKTFTRKLEEILLAHKIEQTYSKNQILEAYLNTVYYGAGSYGAEAAARTYFGKSAHDLTLGEAALLAGLPQRPAAYTPTEHLQAALRRRDAVLDRMVAVGKITQSQAQAARAEKLHLLRPHIPDMNDWKAPYYVTHVLSQLRAAYGPEFLYSGERIETTLNWQMQQAAERALRAGLRHGGYANTGAIVSIEPQTGYVRALVGGPNFRKNQYNAAIEGVRQSGSAFKPFVYATAFDTNVCNLLTQVKDEKLVYPSAPHDYVVHNYDGVYRGDVSVLEALRQSINTVAVKVGDETGPDSIADYAARLGITTPLQPGLPLCLGASGVHPIDLCSAYSAFANGGARYDPAYILRITDATGQTLYQDAPSLRYHPPLLSQSAIDQINVALREVALHGTGAAAAPIPDAHGKTGTTSSHRDAWFVGYTGDLVTAIWVAHVRQDTTRQPSGSKTTRLSYLPMSDATGGSLCAPIWRHFMASTLRVQRQIDAARGRSLSIVVEPTKTALCEELAAQEKTLVAGGDLDSLPQMDREILQVQPQDAATPVGFQPAQDGSNPIIVTAPDTSEAQPNTTQSYSQGDDIEAERGREGEGETY